MRQGRTLLLAGATLGLMVAVGACSTEKEDPTVTVVPPSCPASTMQCADGANALVCPSDGSGWVSYPCAGGCDADVCTTTPCTAGSSECVSDNLAQVCPADGSGWLAVACGLGEVCTNGACAPDPAGPTLCTAGLSECASADVVRTCDTDGLSWFYEGCSAGYVCEDGDCVLDEENALCYPGEGFCSDATTAWVCNASGQGFAEVNCPTGTDCIGGMCVGSNCIVGEQTCLDGVILSECTDGDEWTETLCAPNELCVAFTDGSAECIAPACDPWEQACGDPNDPSVSTTATYSVCEPTYNGTFEWVQHDCGAPLECDPNLLGYYDSPCNAECWPGSERCNGNSRQVCDADGTWGALTACTSGGGEYLECIVKPGGMTADGLSDAICADPVCGYLAVNYYDPNDPNQPELGVCSGSQIRECDLDTLRVPATAADCAVGTCMSTGTVVAGLMAGMCYEQCQAGEERCVLESGTGIIYQTCNSGVWSATTQSCATGLCWDTWNGDLHDVFCGECIDGERRCEDDQIATCTGGTWGTAVDCTLGVCNDYAGQTAACIAECEPGEVYCDFDASWIQASDGTSWGLDAELTCGTDGMFGASTPCTGTETCRITYTGVETGCIECLDGSDGGNDLGLADTRCASGTTLQTCAADVWPTATTCANGTHCEEIEPPPFCDSCFMDGTTPCTESNILAAGYPQGCYALDYTFEPMQCGTTQDCCHSPYYDLFCVPPDPYSSRASACVLDQP